MWFNKAIVPSMFKHVASENGPLVLILQRTCEADQAGENSSFIFTVCVRSVPRYHFKLAYVVLQMAVKRSFRKSLLKMEK